MAENAGATRDKTMVFKKSMFVSGRGKVKDQFWRDLCYLAGVQPECVHDVTEIVTKVDCVEVKYD